MAKGLYPKYFFLKELAEESVHILWGFFVLIYIQ
jgi:hypothetical protein